MRTTISAEKLVRQFDGLTAVDGVDLEIQQGEIYGFLGPNGAGKSTTVRMLCTLLAPTSGRAVVAGHDVATNPGQVRLAIGVALQEAALDPKQTGVELLRLQGRLYGLSKAEIDQRLADLAMLVDIGDALDRRIATYSGGMKRRLDLAAALVHNPEVLFLDEPTTGLDPEVRAEMWQEIEALAAEQGVTVLLTTHYMEEADRLAARLAIVDRGRIVAAGTPDELKRELRGDAVHIELGATANGNARSALDRVEGVREIVLEGRSLHARADDGARAVPGVLAALDANGVPVASVTVARPSLEDVYLRHAGRTFEEAAR